MNKTKYTAYTAPLREVIETKAGTDRIVDLLECGHEWHWTIGNPKTGFGGSSAAKKRRCNPCLREQTVLPKENKS